MSRTTAFLTALGLGAVTMLSAAGTANAATTTLKLCNYGWGYDASLRLPYSNSQSVDGVAPGSCVEAATSTGAPYYVFISRRVGNTYTNRGAGEDAAYREGRTMVEIRNGWDDAYYVTWQY